MDRRGLKTPVTHLAHVCGLCLWRIAPTDAQLLFFRLIRACQSTPSCSPSIQNEVSVCICTLSRWDGPGSLPLGSQVPRAMTMRFIPTLNAFAPGSIKRVVDQSSEFSMACDARANCLSWARSAIVENAPPHRRRPRWSEVPAKSSRIARKSARLMRRCGRRS
jgi:hypothetical protein